MIIVLVINQWELRNIPLFYYHIQENKKIKRWCRIANFSINYELTQWTPFLLKLARSSGFCSSPIFHISMRRLRIFNLRADSLSWAVFASLCKDTFSSFLFFHPTKRIYIKTKNFLQNCILSLWGSSSRFFWKFPLLTPQIINDSDDCWNMRCWVSSFFLFFLSFFSLSDSMGTKYHLLNSNQQAILS